MNIKEKEVSYTSTNSYTTLNSLTDKTKNVWFVCHGIGYLSRYFLKYFDHLNKNRNYIIAPQAQSKYYLGSAYKHVGASWLTKENTVKETKNVIRYFEAVLEVEKIPRKLNFIVLGYSQGVSVALRFVANRKLKCDQLVLMSGRIPKELTDQDFKFLKGKTKVSMIYGNADEYLNETCMVSEKKRYYKLFGDMASISIFNGKHELNKAMLNNFV